MQSLKTYNLTLMGKTFCLIPYAREYSINGRLAIELVDKKTKETFTFLTVNTNEFLSDDKELAFVDTNNNPWAEKFIEDNKLGVKTDHLIISGFWTYTEYRFDLSKLNYEDEDNE